MNLARSCRRIAPVLLVLALLSNARPAHAVSKEIIELQTQVQQIIDSLARLQSANDQQMGVLKDLVQQTVDSVNKMSVTVNGMQLKMQNETDAQSAQKDQLSGQVQSLNDSLDELKARMQRMEKSLTDLQNQAASTNTILGNLPGVNAAPAGAAGAPAAAAPIPTPAQPTAAPAPDAGAPAGPTAEAPAQPTSAPVASGPPVAQMYRAAYSDYMSGRYPLATSEFNDLIKAYPDDNLAGNAYFYLGEIEGHAAKPSAAVRDYDQVLTNFPANAKIPAARLHKGEALLALKQTDAGVHELRALIQRYPNSAEAAQARTKLGALHENASTRGHIE